MKTAAQHDFSYSYGEEVSPELAKKVMDDVYKMVEYKKCIKGMLQENWNFSDEEVEEELKRILEGKE